MKPNQIATLGLRLLGIFCLIDVIPLFSIVPTAVTFAQSEFVGGRSHTWQNVVLLMAAILPFVFKLVVGILLLLRSKTWGERLVQENVAPENTTAISFEQVQALAFAIAGVLIFADALPQLFSSISHLVNWGMAGRDDWQRQTTYGNYSFREVTAAVGVVAKAILGLLLFFRARSFANVWRLLRSYGTPKPIQ